MKMFRHRLVQAMFRRKSGAGKPGRRGPAQRLALERLEDRVVPSVTLTISNPAPFWPLATVPSYRSP
jgi:hypothetical protein